MKLIKWSCNIENLLFTRIWEKSERDRNLTLKTMAQETFRGTVLIKVYHPLCDSSSWPVHWSIKCLQLSWQPVTVTLVRSRLTSWSKHLFGFLGQRGELIFWLSWEQMPVQSPTHIFWVLCLQRLSGICLMTNADCAGGSKWEPQIPKWVFSVWLLR